MIYVDSSALLKLVKAERETEALQAWRDSLPIEHELLTSMVARPEISRTLCRAGTDRVNTDSFAYRALTGVHLIAVTNDVLIRASSYEMRRLGTLDAIHLATADRYRTELTYLVTYDQELAAAAADLGLAVRSPS